MTIKNIYRIVGSPCSGKSTIAELLVNELNIFHYKCDDFYEKDLEIACSRKKAIAKKINSLTIDETFLRPIPIQVQEEIKFYEEIFQIILEDIENLDTTKDIIVEGAAILPRNVSRINVDQNHYICIVPTAEFQLSKYSERKWVNYYLKDSDNKDLAYNNWMARDISFAKNVYSEAQEFGYNSILVDGKNSVVSNAKYVKKCFSLDGNR